MGSFSYMKGGEVVCACRVVEGCGRVVVGVVCVCRVGEGCGRIVVWDCVVLICRVWLSSCVHEVGEGCGGIVVGNGGVLPDGMQLVLVGKPACSQVGRLGVV